MDDGGAETELIVTTFWSFATNYYIFKNVVAIIKVAGIIKDVLITDIQRYNEVLFFEVAHSFEVIINDYSDFVMIILIC